MMYYKVTVLVGIPDSESRDWSENSDVSFHIMDVLNDLGGYNPKTTISTETAVHIIEEREITAKDFKTLRNEKCDQYGGV